MSERAERATHRARVNGPDCGPDVPVLHAGARVPGALPAEGGRKKPAWLMWVATTAGAVFAAYLVFDIGPGEIGRQLRTLGGILPLVMLVTALRFPLQTAGWRLVVPPGERPRWATSLGATIVGESLGYLTWAGPFTGEPARALLLRDELPVKLGIMSGAIERAVYGASAIGVIVAAGLIAAYRAGYVQPALGLACGCLLLCLVFGLRLSSASRASSSPDAAGRLPSGWRTKLASLTGTARELWTERPSTLATIFALGLGQHVLLVCEAWLMLAALGCEVDLGTVVIFEGVTKAVNALGNFIPGRLGVSEGGSALLAQQLGVGASLGLSLALMRRVRATLWGGVAVVLLGARAWRQGTDTP